MMHPTDTVACTCRPKEHKMPASLRNLTAAALVVGLASAAQAQDRTNVVPPTAQGMVSKILGGLGKPGDAATTSSGMSYRVLANGTVEIRNLKYNTVRYAWPQPYWTYNLKDDHGGNR